MRHKLIRRRATDELTVYDLNTEQPIGQIENMTVKGMKMVVDKPVKPASIIYCRMDLPGKILGHKEVFFDAECRWCKKTIIRGNMIRATDCVMSMPRTGPLSMN